MIKITITRTGAAAMGARDWNNLTRDALRELGAFWHGKFRPRRFDESAYNRYRFQQRSRPYRRRKLAAKGHNRPLVWSGDALRDSERFKVTAKATSKRQSVWVRGPRGLNRRPKVGPKRSKPAPNMAEEFRAWTNIERREMQKFLRGAVLRRLRAVGAKQKVTTRLTSA